MVHPTQAVIVMKLMLRDINPTLQLVYNYALQKCIIKAIHKLKFQTLFCSLIWLRAIVRLGKLGKFGLGVAHCLPNSWKKQLIERLASCEVMMVPILISAIGLNRKSVTSCHMIHRRLEDFIVLNRVVLSQRAIK